MNDRRHSGEHRLAEIQEAAEAPKEDRLPRWGVGTWAIVIGLFCMGTSGLTAIGITEYQVTQLENWRKEHTDEVKTRREAIEAKFRAVEETQRLAERDHEHRLTMLEDHWTDLLTRLARIENKLDDKKSH